MMRWLASIIWALTASFLTNGLLAFGIGGLDHAWVMAVITFIWLVVFLIACPKFYDASHRPTRTP